MKVNLYQTFAAGNSNLLSSFPPAINQQASCDGAGWWMISIYICLLAGYCFLFVRP